MRLVSEARSYATQANALRHLAKFIELDSVAWRWLVAINAKGRFTPVVVPSDEQMGLVNYLASHGISVVR